MKIYRWIKVIGIACIVFGVFALLASYFSLLTTANLTEGGEKSPELPAALLSWRVGLAYAGILIYIAYTAAGILFLVRKPIALPLITTSLVASIFIKVLPMLLVSHYGAYPAYGFIGDVTELIGPLIDLGLLAAVWRIRPYYHLSHEALAAHPKISIGKLPVNARKWKRLSAFGGLCLLIPLYLFSTWIYAYHAGSTHEENKLIYEQFIPGFLEQGYRLAYLGAILSLITIFISGGSLKLPERRWKVINGLLLGVSIFLFLVFFFFLL